jgi:hypothetical protein
MHVVVPIGAGSNLLDEAQPTVAVSTRIPLLCESPVVAIERRGCRDVVCGQERGRHGWLSAFAGRFEFARRTRPD